MSEWMSRCVDSVDERLKAFPHIRHSNVRSCRGKRGAGESAAGGAAMLGAGLDPAGIPWEWTSICCSRLTAWPKDLPQISQEKGRIPL